MNQSDSLLKEPDHIWAREILHKRYVWEVEAITQDILNKLEMGVLTTSSIASYLSNLLASHPRMKDRSLAAETLMCSVGEADGDAIEELLDPWKDEGLNGTTLQQMAYWNMASDVLGSLQDKGVHITVNVKE